MKPLITFEDGEAKIIDKARGERKAISALLERCMKERRPGTNYAIVYGCNTEALDHLKEACAQIMDQPPIAEYQVGCVISINTGPNMVGILYRTYGNASPNTFEPLNAPGEGITAAGQYKINDIAYGTEFPNSFLDITYPDANTESDRPTLFYFHGGGFFGGSKNMGDPMAANDATALIDDLCAQGCNIVNVD